MNDIVNECSVDIDAYFRETILEKYDILEWSQQNKFKFPNIFQLVKKYLCIPATSCPSERVFSKAGEIVCKKRSKLSQKHVNQLIFLNHNLRNFNEINFIFQIYNFISIFNCVLFLFHILFNKILKILNKINDHYYLTLFYF